MACQLEILSSRNVRFLNNEPSGSLIVGHSAIDQTAAKRVRSAGRFCCCRDLVVSAVSGSTQWRYGPLTPSAGQRATGRLRALSRSREKRCG